MVNDSPESDVLTTGQVAAVLNVDKKTVRKWTNLGVLSSRRIGVRKDRVFTRVDIDSFLKELNHAGSNIPSESCP